MGFSSNCKFIAMKILWMFFVGLLSSGLVCAESNIRLILRGDDMGSAHAANEACIKSYRDGIMKSVEVMVPGGWFPEAVKMLRENPGLDVGVHLCLTSEWEGCKWRPLTYAPSLVDENGYFYPMTSQRKDFPPKTGFLQGSPDLKEVEKELRAQIEMAVKHIPQTSHISAHMGTATATPQLREIVNRLAQEYRLHHEQPQGVRYAAGFTGRSPAERETSLVRLLEQLTPGNWLLIEHPGFDTPEMRGLGHRGYEYVAEERNAVTHAFTSPLVKQVIQKRGIQVMSYAEFYRQARATQ